MADSTDGSRPRERAAARPPRAGGPAWLDGEAGRATLRRLYHLRRDPPPRDAGSFPGVDPWRWQYFEGTPCPQSVAVPIDDPAAWRCHPRYRFVYDKLFICASQGVAQGPHGVRPRRFPVFSKPMMNLHGMGTGGFIVRSAAELEARYTPGHMWMALRAGIHLSTDVALVRGAPRWWRHTKGKAIGGGAFDYWVVLSRRRPRLEAYCARWIARYLRGFTGIVNLETIGGVIIECHLRMSEQWLDLNGPGWLRSVVELYARGRWRFSAPARTGYSVVLFGPHGPRYWIDPDAVEALRRTPGVSSIQITFDPRTPAEQHAMPPGGFRLAIVNCWNLDAGLAARRRLRVLFTAAAESGAAAMNGEAPPRARREGGAAAGVTCPRRPAIAARRPT